MYRKEIAYYYSEYSVNRSIDNQRVINNFLTELTDCQQYIFEKDSTVIVFYFKFLEWESTYFSLNSLQLRFVDFENCCYTLLQESIKSFIKYLKGIYYKFIITIEIPSRDNRFIQILNQSGFRLIETRLHYYITNLENLNGPRASVRKAEMGDIENLKRLAKEMRNDYDRFHSDFNFDETIADNYLATYVENSVKGFTDLVMVPNEPGLPSDSFLTANFLKNKWKDLDHNISKMILSAVSANTNKGWYVKLISEMNYKLKEEGAQTIFLNTQATNIAVLYTWEKLGYHIGRATHVLTNTIND